MLFLTKLRKLTVCAVVVLALACGFGAAALPAADADDAAPPKASATTETSGAKPSKAKLDDKEYLRRVCIDLRGTGPTEIETTYFIADTDQHKRSKVVEWLLEDPQAQAWRESRLRKPVSARLAQCTSCHQAAFLGLEREAPGTGMAADWFHGAHRPFLHAVRDVTIDIDNRIDAKPSADAAKEGKAVWVDELFELHAPDEYWSLFVLGHSDGDFLQRACQEARGSAPTHLEMEYFKADKDPKKRDKLLDMFLKDPAVAKKLGDGWKQKMLQPAQPPLTGKLTTLYRYHALDARGKYTLAAKTVKPTVPERLVQLLDKLLKDKRGDEQVLEALALATLGRLPTESEKKLVVDSVAKQPDKVAAWRDVLKTFAGTQEARQHAEELNRGSGKLPKQ